MTKVGLRFGSWGEQLAAVYLQESGLVLLDTNWRTGIGEVDIIAREGDALVFCEVKTRRSGAFGDPAEAVTQAKARRLRRLAARWLEITGIRAKEVRFDLVKVMAPRGGQPAVEHIRDAF